MTLLKINDLDKKATVIEIKIDSINNEICEVKDILTKIESCPIIKNNYKILIINKNKLSYISAN